MSLFWATSTYNVLSTLALAISLGACADRGGSGGYVVGTCGDGLLDPGEACDLGEVNGVVGGACSMSCEVIDRPCGNGRLDPREECDEGPANSDSGPCTSACRHAICGDSLVGPDEECDDGNMEDGDGCGWDCLSPGSTRWRLTFSDPVDPQPAGPVTIGPDGSIYMLGQELTKYTAGGMRVWGLARVGNAVYIHGLVMDGGGVLFAAGAAIARGDLEYTPWIGRIDATSGTYIDAETVAFWLRGTRFHMFYSLVAAPGGGVFVVGSGETTWSTVSTYARVATSGAVLGVTELPGTRFFAAVRSDAGKYLVHGGEDPASVRFISDALVAGAPTRIEMGVDLRAAEGLADDSLVLAGRTLATHPTGIDHAWMERRDATGTVQWTFDYPTGAGTTQGVGALTRGYGDIFVAGTNEGKPWVGRLDGATGAIVWQQFEAAPRPDLSRAYPKLALHPTTGLVVYGTLAHTSGPQTSWLEVLVP